MLNAVFSRVLDLFSSMLGKFTFLVDTDFAAEENSPIICDITIWLVFLEMKGATELKP